MGRVDSVLILASPSAARSREWRNWAGDQRCLPARIERPGSRAELIESVARAGEGGLRIKAAGSGHSFTDIACTEGLMLDLRRLDRVLDFDRRSGLVKVEGGIELREMNERLWGEGRALENLGDIDRQLVAGAVSTGTHGTGARFRNMSSLIEAVELVGADGRVTEISAASDPDALSAARVGLGALGVIASITFRTVPAFSIRRIDSPLPLAETLERLDELADGCDHFEFYVFPHTDVALLRLSERTDSEPDPPNRLVAYARDVVLENWVIGALSRLSRRAPSRTPQLARFVSRRLGGGRTLDRGYRVYASQRRVRFTEMEYAIPREHASEAIRRVLELASRPELAVFFPIEVRFVAADEAMLSPSHERASCYIAVHMFEGMPWERYFRGVEAIADEYGGRPHWGKRHFQTAATLSARYPRWRDFARVRARLDPGGAFANDYLDRVLG